MAVSENPADGIIVLGAATDTISRDKMPVDFIILNATAAGAFALVLGRTTINIEAFHESRPPANKGWSIG